jgi:hypothetical protein
VNYEQRRAWQRLPAAERLDIVCDIMRRIRPASSTEFDRHRPEGMPGYSGLVGAFGLTFPEWRGVFGGEEPAYCDCGQPVTTARMIRVGHPNVGRSNRQMRDQALPLCDSCAAVFDEDEQRWQS